MYLSLHTHHQKNKLAFPSYNQSLTIDIALYCTDNTAVAAAASQPTRGTWSTVVKRAMRHRFTTSPANEVTTGGGSSLTSLNLPPHVKKKFLSRLSATTHCQQDCKKLALSLSLNELHGISYFTV